MRPSTLLTDFQLDSRRPAPLLRRVRVRGPLPQGEGRYRRGECPRSDAAIKVRDSYPKGNAALYDMPAAGSRRHLLCRAPEDAPAHRREALSPRLRKRPASSSPRSPTGSTHTPKGLRASVMSPGGGVIAASATQKQMESTARRLIEVDPNGPGGKKGREILGGGRRRLRISELGQGDGFSRKGRPRTASSEEAVAALPAGS
jgi:hypothetical protein